MSLKSLMLQKLRSGLTMLGIVFGVFSVIAMLAIGEGASSQAQKQVLELGAKNIIVISVKPPDGTSSKKSAVQARVLRYGLKWSDYELLAGIRTVENVIPFRELTKEIRYLHRTLNSRLVGCTSDYSKVNHLIIDQGRFLSDRDQQDMANVCVLASTTAETLFPAEDPLGKSVQIDSRYYNVIGVTRTRSASAAIGGSFSGQDFNKDIYIPLKTMRVRMGNLNIRVVPGSFSAEEVELHQITLQVAKQEDVIPTSEVVLESISRAHEDTHDVNVIVPLELLKQADQLRQIFNIVLGSIAAISLVVGGIGIMNIMLATVTERTREIGIRRALGAKQRDIIQQFLTETIVLSGVGGLIGIMLGLSTPFSFTLIKSFVTRFVLDAGTSSSNMGKMFSEMEPQVALWSLPLAFGISVGIGVIFGMYPARSAARLDPIEALRHE